MYSDPAGDDDALFGLRMEAVDLFDAIMRNDVVAARLYAQLLAIHAGSLDLAAIGRAARDVLERLGTNERIPQKGIGQALTSLGDLVNPPNVEGQA